MTYFLQLRTAYFECILIQFNSLLAGGGCDIPCTYPTDARERTINLTNIVGNPTTLRRNGLPDPRDLAKQKYSV